MPRKPVLCSATGYCAATPPASMRPGRFHAPEIVKTDRHDRWMVEGLRFNEAGAFPCPGNCNLEMSQVLFHGGAASMRPGRFHAPETWQRGGSCLGRYTCASMRPGRFHPGNLRIKCSIWTRPHIRFNEVGAFPPRKFNAGYRNAHRSQMCFNEAGAFPPRKCDR